MLKEFKEELKKPLTIITNMPFITGQFPTKGRESHIIPSYKKGDKSECSNYRPISLLPNTSKIIEKAMYTRLYNFLENIIVSIKNNSDLGIHTQPIML